MKNSLQLLDKLTLHNDENKVDVNFIIDSINEKVFSIRTEEETRVYIQNHQIALHELLKLNPTNHSIESLLYFIEVYFPNYVNTSLPISDSGRKRILDSIGPKVEDIKIQLNEMLNKKLIAIMFPLFNIDDCIGLSIYDARFIDVFWQEWVADFEQIITLFDETAVINFLILQNFNPNPIFNYIKEKVVSELSDEENPYVQEVLLETHLIQLNKVFSKLSKSYRVNNPIVKKVIIKWLNNEICQCHKKQSRYNPNQQQLIPKEINKIELDLSVAQIAYFFKLMFDNGLIISKVQKEIHAAICVAFRSRKTDSISLESLNNKYYNVEQQTKDIVKAF